MPRNGGRPRAFTVRRHTNRYRVWDPKTKTQVFVDSLTEASLIMGCDPSAITVLESTTIAQPITESTDGWTATKKASLSESIETLLAERDQISETLAGMYIRRQGMRLNDEWSYCYGCGHHLVRSPVRVCYQCNPARKTQ